DRCAQCRGARRGAATAARRHITPVGAGRDRRVARCASVLASRQWQRGDRGCDLPRGATRRRAAALRAPFAYAVRRASFRHLTLDVDERVLIPRPETEGLVEQVLQLSGGMGGTAVDIGTGSGAIALSLASEGIFDRVVATDVSLDALAVARLNASRLAGALRAPVEFRHGSLLAPITDLRAAVIVSNPPYIAYHEAAELPAGVRDWE